MKYTEFKRIKEKGVNDFPMFFAFSNKQLEEGKEKMGIKENSELLSIGAGGYIKKTDREAFRKLMETLDITTNKFLKKKDQLIDALVYELGNHEYCITCDVTDTLESLGLKQEKLNDMQKEALKEAKIIYQKQWIEADEADQSLDYYFNEVA